MTFHLVFSMDDTRCTLAWHSGVGGEYPKVQVLRVIHEDPRMGTEDGNRSPAA